MVIMKSEQIPSTGNGLVQRAEVGESTRNKCVKETIFYDTRMGSDGK